MKREVSTGKAPSKRKISVSEANLYLTCGHAWEKRYVERLKMPPSANLTRGRVVDQAVNYNLAQKVDTGVDLNESQVLEVFSDAFDREAKDTDWRGEDPGAAKDSWSEVIRAHHRTFAPEIMPARTPTGEAAVQERWVLDLDRDYFITGVWDIRTSDRWLRDTKAAGRKGTVPGVKRALQPVVYDFVLKEFARLEPEHYQKPKGFKFDITITPTTRQPARTDRVEGRITKADHRLAFNLIDNAVRGMEAGVVLPPPEGHWKCSEAYCEFWSVCERGGAK